MYSTPDHPQQWSVHAEFTISHPGISDPQNPPKTSSVQDEKGVRMLYSWTGSNSSEDADKLCGFQKGNLFFTSTPPANKTLLNVATQDSAYGSDLHSASSCSSTFHPFNRKCKSTCNIVLSPGDKRSAICDRTQSLRCQTPSLCCDKKSDGYYGCGDPWCHHLQYNDEFSTSRKISPVREACEDSNIADTCGETCPICNPINKKSVKRDVSVQTYEMVNKSTSPMLKQSEREHSVETGKSNSKLKKSRNIGSNQNRQYSVRSSSSPSTVRRDKSEDLHRLSRSRSFRGESKSYDSKGSGSDKSDSSKKPRTIHIDVYCTGTEIESDTSSSSESSRSKSVSTPQTVFESKKMCITHKKGDDKKLPHYLNETNEISTYLEKNYSDNDDSISTAYPSKISSYSTIGRSLSSMSSFPNSVTPFSMSSCTVPDYESSVGNTSWKDTFSDIDSLIHSHSSIPQNDSLYFIPKRIDEEVSSTCGSQKITNTSATNSVNLAPSDSFDYADSEDKLRIKRMERMWKNKLVQHYNINKKNLQEQEKLQEVVNKRLSKMNVSKDSDSDASDGSEKGWAVLNQKTTNVLTKSSSQDSYPVMIADIKHTESLQQNMESKSSICKSPSTVIIKQKLSVDPSLGSPFTIVPGVYTEPRSIAKRFGPVITVFKKPGHHVGPAKNPNCSCDHCKKYFENMRFRNRTASVGDTPQSPPLFLNWKGLKNRLSNNY